MSDGETRKIVWSSFFTPYTETSVKTNVPQGKGVYLLWVKYSTGRWECFYVGQADDLQKRLLDHLSDQEENKCIKENVKYTCGFYYANVSLQSDRDGIEKALYDYYETPCNQNDPGGTPIHLNVPAKKT